MPGTNLQEHSLLAMGVNDDVDYLTEHDVLGFIASKLRSYRMPPHK